MTRKGRQTQLGSALEGELRRLDRKSGGAYTSARVMLAWDRVSGPGIAKHTTGAHLRDGELVVYVDHNAWSTEYTAMSEQFRRSINEEVGEELVRKIRFPVSRKVSDQHKLQHAEIQLEEFYKEDDVPSIPLTELERAQIEASVAEIRDSELREAVLRATVADLEWKKGIAARNEAQEPRESF